VFYQALKAGAAIKIWLWLKPRLFGFVILIASIAAILIAHGEYLNYVDRTGNADNVGMSYLFKWLGLLFVVFAYGVYNWFSIKRALKKRAKAIEQNERMEDGFDFLRNKRKLESKRD
jgi:hypothetical protein